MSQNTRLGHTRLALSCLLALLVGGASAFAAPESPRRADDGPAVHDELLAAAPSSNLADLAGRLETLGASELGIRRLLAALEREAGPDATAAALSDLGLLESRLDKAADLVMAYRSGQPVALVGLVLPLEDRLFLAEALRLGVEPGAAGWLTLRARELGWPAAVAERETLRGAVTQATEDASLREDLLDTAVLRRDAATLLSNDERRRLLTPIDGLDSPVLPDAAVCRECPSWNYGLFLPTDAWQTHAATLAVDECKVYRFAVTAGQAYRFSFCEGGGTADFDSVLFAQDVTCAAAGISDDVCGTNADLVATSPFTGYFYVQVSANAGGSGDYTLAFKKADAAPGAGTCKECPEYDQAPGTPLPAWRTAADRILPGGCRVFHFPVLLNHTYRFTTCEAGSGGSATFDTVIETKVNGQRCLPGPGNDDSCGLGSTVEFTPAFSQGISVTVRGYDSLASGDFVLAFRDVTGECQDCADTTVPALFPDAGVQYASGLVPAGGGCDTIPVSVEAGKSYRIDVCDPGAATAFTPSFEAFDDGCNPIALQSTDGCGLLFQPCYTGTAYVRISQAGGGTGGSYTFAYTEHCAWVGGCGGGRVCADQAGPLTPTTSPQPAYAYLPADGCRVFAFNLEAYKTYRFAGCQGPGFIAPGQFVSFRMRLPDCSACNPANAGSCGGTSPRLEFTPEVDGVYHLVVSEDNGVSGDIAVSYREVDADCSAPDTTDTIAAGEFDRRPDSVTVKNGANLHAFVVEPGRRYRFSICTTDSGGNPTMGSADPGLDWLLVQMSGGPSPCTPDVGQLLTSDACPGELDIIGPASGEIILKVARRCSPGGSYQLSYQDITTRVAFATSGRYRGDLDGFSGLSGGDDICNLLAAAPTAHPVVAAAVNAGATFVAWLSDSANDAGDRLGLIGAPPGAVPGWSLPDGTAIVSDGADLLSPFNLLHAIDMTEQGVPLIGNFQTWTGTNTSGTWTGMDCLSWSVGTPVEDGTQGLADQVDGRWTDQVDRPCDRRRHLYCFESTP